MMQENITYLMMLTNPESCLKDLKNNYTRAGHPVSYSGINNIYKYYNGMLSIDSIENFLSANYAYTIHKETKKLKRVNPTFKYFR